MKWVIPALLVAVVVVAVLLLTRGDDQTRVEVRAGDAMPSDINRSDDYGADTLRAYLTAALECDEAALARYGTALEEIVALCDDRPDEIDAEVAQEDLDPRGRALWKVSASDSKLPSELHVWLEQKGAMGGPSTRVVDRSASAERSSAARQRGASPMNAHTGAPSSTGMERPIKGEMISPIAIDSGLSVRGQRSTVRISDIDRLAARGGVPSSQLRDLIENGGRMSFVRGAPLDGLPLTPDGAPDFERIIAAGGRVEGALPDGLSSMTTVGIPGANSRQTVYAAKVTLADGSTRYVKGGTMAQAKDEASMADTLRALGDLLDFIDSLPNSIEEARSRFAGTSASLIDIRV